MKKSLIWKIDFAISLIVLVGFEVIDYSLNELAEAPFYNNFINTAKWLLIGGFTLHGLLNWWLDRAR